MPTVVQYPHIEKPAGKPARLERLPRIRVSQIVLPHLMHGWSAEEIGRQYPHLSMAEIHAALAYYFDRPEEITQEVEAELAEDDQWRTKMANNPFMLRLRMKLRG